MYPAITILCGMHMHGLDCETQYMNNKIFQTNTRQTIFVHIAIYNDYIISTVCKNKDF